MAVETEAGGARAAGGERTGPSTGRRRKGELLAYLVPPVMIATVVLAITLGRHGSPRLLGLLLGALVVVPILWVFVSALWPGKADRRCPRCKRDALRRMDERTTVGLECRACGHVDETASGWFLAEEEDSGLEEIVMEKRRGGRERIRMGAHSDVDSHAGAN